MATSRPLQEIRDPNRILLRGAVADASEKIREVVQQGRSIAEDRGQLFMFKGMYKRLSDYYSDFNASWAQLKTHCISQLPPAAPFPSPEEKDIAAKVERYYTECHAIYEEYMNPTPQAQAHSQSTATGPNISAVDISLLSRARLPQMNLPTFSGNHMEWPFFKETFQNSVHNDPILDDMSKYQYLRGALRGDALNVIRCVPFAAQNYEQAWQALLREYDNKRVLANAYLNAIMGMKPLPNSPSLTAFKEFVQEASANVRALRLLGIPNESEFILFFLVSRTLNRSSRQAFERQHPGVEFPKVEELIQFILSECRTLEAADNQGPSTSTSQSPHGSSAPRNSNQRMPFVSNQRVNSDKRYSGTALVVENGSPKSSPPTKVKVSKCHVCGSTDHKLTACSKFLDLSPSQRAHALKTWQGCLNCLSPSHLRTDCGSRFKCRHCGRAHHTLLHYGRGHSAAAQPNPAQRDNASPTRRARPAPKRLSPSRATAAPVETSPAVTGNVAQCTSGSSISNHMLSHQSVLLGTALAQIKDAQGRHQQVRLLLDSGSQFTFISSSCASRLGFAPQPCSVSIKGIGSNPVFGAEGTIPCTLDSSPSCGTEFRTQAVVLPHIISQVPQQPLSYRGSDLLNRFQLADPHFWEPSPIDILLGADLFFDIISGPPVRSDTTGLYLLPTFFGHVLAGRTQLPPVICGLALTVQALGVQTELSRVMQQFWSIEEVTNEISPSEDDHYCEDHFMSTHRQLPSGRYCVSLPFKENPPVLGSSKPQALKRFLNLEAKLQRNSPLRESYIKFMDEYLALGHMRLATSPAKYYIPHHCISNEEGKFRVVFDASSATSKGSLNDKLHVGPKLQGDIGNIILHFRTFRIAFTTDIVKMYRQINLNRDDLPFHHILWRHDPASPIEDYELTTVTYGVKSSSFCAIRTLQQLARDHSRHFPKAARALMKSSYVDDIMSGGETVEEALKTQEQLIALLGLGNFPLSKWASNHPSLLERVGGANEPHALNPDESVGVKVLGLQWEPREDVLSYRLQPPPQSVSKRAILSCIARIYDVLGYLSPVVFLAKTILQDAWLAKVDWDCPLPRDVSERWTTFTQDLQHLKDVRIPRLLPDITSNPSFLFGFCDASARGYAAVIYLRPINSNHISILKSKTKLAPTKPLSIPRLELCAALLLVRLLASVQDFLKSLTIQQSTFFSDSSVVLAWLRTPPSQLKVFVAHRVVEILEATTADQWRHVRSQSNPADCASRGLLPSQMGSNSLWWSGPTWISEPPENWPTVPSLRLSDDIPELKADVSSCLSCSHSIPQLVEWVEHFSSYARLVRSVGYVMRFLTPGSHRTRGAISLSEIRAAENKIFLLLQGHYLVDPNGQPLPQLSSLHPFIDDHGLLRVGGRLENSDLPFHHKHPIILPKRSPITAALVNHYHILYLHLGPSLLQAVLSRRFWIPSGRSLIRNCVRKCLRCFRAKARTQAPRMGDLPSFRVTPSRPFLHVGVDFAGPFLLRTSPKRNAGTYKGYLCVFVCMAVKAVHLELVTSLSTDAFIACLQRFAARRGKPQCLYSDNGTNFVGAYRHLKEVSQWLRAQHCSEEVQHFCTQQEIAWSFQPPASPHFGGLFEAAVKSAKSILRKVTSQTTFSQEEAVTLFSRIEAILNSRPLCPLTADPDNLDALTPGHFLIGAPLISVPEHHLLDERENYLSRWQLVQQRTQHFWQRWRQEYLNHLQQRPKWRRDIPNLSPGDLVLLKDSSSPPLCWPMGRIAAVFPGVDGVVRVADVRLRNSVYRRPASKLVNLSAIVGPQGASV